LHEVAAEMESSGIVVVHPELDEQRRIGEAPSELGRPIEFAADFEGLARILRSTRVGLVVSARIKVPREKPKIVEGIQRSPSAFRCSSSSTIRAT
jgi:hypothetical protein